MFEVYRDVDDTTTPPASSEKRPVRQALAEVTNRSNNKSNLIKSVAAVKDMQNSAAKFISKPANPLRKGSIDAAFDALDANKDGVITREEWTLANASNEPQGASPGVGFGAGSAHESPLPGYYSPLMGTKTTTEAPTPEPTGGEDSPGIAEVLARNKDLLSRPTSHTRPSARGG